MQSEWLDFDLYIHNIIFIFLSLNILQYQVSELQDVCPDKII